MELFSVVLMVATLLCALVAGLVLAFAVVVMPGIGSLGDREFLRAFQAMDDMIQDRQPVFMVVWVGSIVAVLGGTGGFFHAGGRFCSSFVDHVF